MAHDGAITEPHKPFCLLEGGRKPGRHEASDSPTRENRNELNFGLHDAFSQNFGQPVESMTVTESGHESDGDLLGATKVTKGHDLGLSAMKVAVTRCVKAPSLSCLKLAV